MATMMIIDATRSIYLLSSIISCILALLTYADTKSLECISYSLCYLLEILNQCLSHSHGTSWAPSNLFK